MRIVLMAAWLVVPLSVMADEKKEIKKGDSPLEMKVILKKDTIVWDADAKARGEFKAALEKSEMLLKKKSPELVTTPTLPLFEATVQFKNTSNKDVTMTVEGDSCRLTFFLKGPGVIELSPPRAVTLDFRMGKPLTLKPGDKYEIPVTKLCDGFRMLSRDIFWTELGEYTLSASYTSGNAEEGKSDLLHSEPVKFKVVEKK